MPDAICIYCSRPFNPKRWQGDHILPVQFGAFRYAKRFRGCCVGCNNDIGKSEEQLIRCGWESVALDELSPAVPKSRKRGSGARVGAHGAPPPRHFVVAADHETIVIPYSPGKVLPTDGLHLRYKSGETENIRLFPQMSEGSLRRLLEHRKAIGIESIHLQSDKANYARYTDLLRRLLPGSTCTSLPDTPAGISDVTVRTELTVTSRHFRALAKIGFHYYLAYSARGFTGHESVFSKIRGFILNGGDPAYFLVDRGIRFGNDIAEWLERHVGEQGRCHILGIEDNLDRILVFVKMFHGDTRSVCYAICLATVTSGWTYFDRRATAFVYDMTQPECGFAGKAHALPCMTSVQMIVPGLDGQTNDLSIITSGI